MAWYVWWFVQRIFHGLPEIRFQINNYGTQGSVSHLAASFPPLSWFRNPSKNQPHPQNSFSQQTTDNAQSQSIKSGSHHT